MSSKSSYIKATEIQVLTLAGDIESTDISGQLPFLRFLLENDSDFIMNSIPMDVAIAISMHLGGTSNQDSRLRIHDLVGELAQIEKVEIDTVIPGTTVYQATIFLRPEGFSHSLKYQMIPSNATLLAVLNEAPIFVSERLWKEFLQAKQQISMMDDEDSLDSDENVKYR